MILFVGSGTAALIYEVVWFQLLQLVIGSSAISLGLLLGTFMGGMCLGSLLLARFVGPRHHPLRVYALLELGIGLLGIAIYFLVPLVGTVYTRFAGTFAGGPFGRALVASICLLPASMLMGATLPAVARWIEATPKGVSWLGLFYGGNIAGAVLGSLFAGFYLLRVHDQLVATLFAAGLNLLVAGLALVATRAMRYEDRTGEVAASAEPDRGSSLLYFSIAFSGMAALGSEVIWTRNLSLLFGATVYTFSLIVAAFLSGLGIGSGLGSLIARRTKCPALILAICQLLLVGTIAWAAYMIGNSLPYWPVDPDIRTDPLSSFQVDFVRSLWTILPSAILWGASFPLCLASAASGAGQDAGKIVGKLYAANTVGAIAGAILASLILVRWFGSDGAQQALAASCVAASLLAFVSGWRTGERLFKLGPMNRAAAALASVVVVLIIRSIPGIPPVLITSGRHAALVAGRDEIVYAGEGLVSSVAVSRTKSGVVMYHNAGKAQATSNVEDMRLQRMLGHLTTLLTENPESVLVIGCGAGVTAGAVALDPAVKRVTIAEIEPLVPAVAANYFGEYNHQVITDPKVRVEVDDGRHFLFTTDERFDAITSDPLDPWVKGAAMLYTREFFNAARERLNPGGVITIFVQLYQTSEDAVRSELATFFEVFPEGIVCANTEAGEGYDLVLVARLNDKPIDLDAIDDRLSKPDYIRTAESLREIGFSSAVDLLATYAGSGSDLKPWLNGAEINRDRNLRLQYLAGLSLNLDESDRIYRNMVKPTRFPDGLFAGSEHRQNGLRKALGLP